jgi:hypothetical protein
MRRERALKVVLVLVGLLFTAMVYPLVLFVRQEPALAMQFSVYVTLVDLSPILRQPVKTQNTANGGFESWECLEGELLHGSSSLMQSGGWRWEFQLPS